MSSGSKREAPESDGGDGSTYLDKKRGRRDDEHNKNVTLTSTHADTPTPTVNILQLPPEVMLKIFGYLNGTSLGRAEAVCRKWRGEIRDRWNIVHLWSTMCAKRGLESSNFERHHRYRLKTWMANASLLPPDSSAYGHNSVFLGDMWRQMFIKYRRKICRHCLKFDVSVQCGLFRNLPLCKECRVKMPFAPLLAAHARHYFKFDPSAAESVLGYAPKAAVLEGKQTSYRFTDVEKYAQLKFGADWADERAMVAKRELGIGQMTGVPLLKDV